MLKELTLLCFHARFDGFAPDIQGPQASCQLLPPGQWKELQGAHGGYMTSPGGNHSCLRENTFQRDAWFLTVRTHHQERTLSSRYQLTDDRCVSSSQSAPFLNLKDTRDTSQQRPEALYNLESQAGGGVTQSKVFA